MGDRLKVSVIIPHFQDLEGLALCLDGLERQTYPKSAFEIVVADNAEVSDPRTVDVVAGRGRIVIVPERGAGPARNGGVAASTGEMLAFTDSDCLPEPRWLEQGVAALQHYDLVGGRMRVLVDDWTRLAPEEAFEVVFAFHNEDYVRQKGFTVTANMFCSRRVFDVVGRFRSGIPEDLEWAHRARACGYRIGYASDAVVGHPARRNWAELKRKWVRLNQEAYRLSADRAGGKQAWFYRSLALPVSALFHTPKVLLNRALPSWGDKVAALRVLYRLRMWRAVEGVRRLIQS